MPVFRASACDNSRMWKILKRFCGLGALATVGYGLWWAFDRRTPGRVAWEAQPLGPPADEPAPEPQAPPWLESADDGSCPLTHPVKSKLASGIFHVPGGASYARTRADRCYRTADAATADGLRAAKR
jgi:hypothetical protein